MSWFKKRFPFLWRLAEVVDTVLGYYERVPALAKHMLGAILTVALASGGGSLVKWVSVLQANWPLTLIGSALVGAVIWAVLEALHFRRSSRPPLGPTHALADNAAKTAPNAPRIKLACATVSQLPIARGDRISDKLVAIATVSFYNDPITRTPDTNAHHARAEVTVFSERFEVMTKEHEAYWVTKTKGGGFTAIEPSLSQRSVDLLNSGQQRELGLLLRFPREPVHFFAPSAFTSSGSLHPSFALKSDRFFVRVRIFAQGVDGDEFWFHITQGSDGKMQITPIMRNDAPFSIDTSVKDNWLHLVLDNSAETREFECRADILKREFADYGKTPWWVKWRGKTSEQVRRVVTQAELDFIRYELPVDDAGRSLVPGVLHCHSTTLFNEGFEVRPGQPVYATMSPREMGTPREEEDVPFSVEVSSLDPKEVMIRTILVGFRVSGVDGNGSRMFVFYARFLEDAMKSS